MNTSPERVLVIDDNPDDRALIVRELRREFPGLRTEEVAEADALERALGRGDFDLVITDYQLRWTDGLRVLRAVKARHPDRPVIMFTATGSQEIAVEAMKSGLDDYVIKSPKHFIRLAVAVRFVMEKAGQRRALRRAEDALRQRAEELERASRLKDEFLATVSHELRTPMTAIVGWLHLLRTGQLDQPQAGRALETIERNARAQMQLIDDLLDVSRIITGKLRLDVRPLDLSSVIGAALDVVRPAADAKGIQLHVDLDPSAAAVEGDAGRLQQVVWNLLSNAVKFTPRGGRVEVRLGRADAYAQIMVTDTGQGISAEFLPFVFDRFRQADQRTTRRHGGLGLGLAIVRHLVELHGGTVHAESGGEGRGAAFTVRLPLDADRPEPKPPVAWGSREAGGSFGRPPDLAGVRVLAVDNEVDTLEMISLALTLRGAEVRSAASAAEGFDAVTQWKPDVLVFNIQMPGEDGYELIRKVRALGPERGGDLPAVALTAYARAEDREKALSAGYQMHVTKPADPAQLAAAIASLAGRRKGG